MLRFLYYVKWCFLAALLTAANLTLSAQADVIREDQNLLTKEIGTPVYIWRDTQMKPRFAIICIQGAILHGRAYDAIARKLAAKDALVVAPDFYGFGAWYRGTDGFTVSQSVDIPKSKEMLGAICDKIKDTYKIPVMWMGESSGANMAVRMSKEKGGPLIIASFAPKQRLFFHPLMLGQAAHVFWSPHCSINISAYLNPRLSEDPEIVKECANDPLNRYVFKPLELYSIAKSTGIGIKLASKLDPDTPVLFVHGKLDRLVHTDDVQDFYDHFNCRDKRLLMFDKVGHIHFETSHLDPDLVETVSDWAYNHAGPTALIRTAMQYRLMTR